MNRLKRSFEKFRKMKLIFALVLIGASHLSFAQGWVLRVLPRYEGSTVGSCNTFTGTVTVSFSTVSPGVNATKTVSVSKASNGVITPSIIDLPGTGPFNSRFTITVNISCGGFDPGIHVTHSEIINFGDPNCFTPTSGFTSTTFNTGNVGTVAGTLVLYGKLIASVDETQECDGVYGVGAFCATVGALRWEVTDNPEVPSRTMVVTPSNGRLTTSQLQSPNFTTSGPYGLRHIRVTDLGLPGRTSDFKEFYISLPGPTVNATTINPTCFGETGGVVMNITPHPQISEVNRLIQEVLPNNQYRNVWQDGEIPPRPSPPPLAVGTYNLIVTNKPPDNQQYLGTCYTTRQFVIDDPEQVRIISTDVDDALCKGVSTGKIRVLSTTGGSNTGYSYTIDGADMPSGLAENLTAKNYTLVAKDSRGCVSPPKNETVGEPTNAITATLNKRDYRGYGVKCWDSTDGEITSTIAHSVGPISYEWFMGATKINGEIGVVLSNRGPETYHVKVTDGNGCTDESDNITLTPPPQIDFSISRTGTLQCPGDNTITLNSSVVATTITGPPSYSWSRNGETTPSLLSVGQGNYSLTVSDNQGCFTTKTEPITDPPAHTVNIAYDSDYNGKQIKCNGGNDGKLRAVVSDPLGNATSAQHYEWFRNTASFDGGAAMNSISGLNEATYKVIITYNSTCKAEATLPLSDPDPVVPRIDVIYHNGKDISCPGLSDGRMVATKGTGGTGVEADYTYVWSTGETVPSVTGKRAGNYFVTAKDKNLCPGTTNVTLSDPAPINPSITIVSPYNGFPLRCHNSSDARLDVSATGGAGTINFTWSTGVTGPTLNNVPGGAYTVTARDANGCTETDSETVVKPNPVTATISIVSNFNGQPISCFGRTDAELKATGGGGTNSFNYSWSTGASGSNLAGIGAGTFNVTITDTNGCPAMDSEMLANPTPVRAVIDAVSNYNGFGVHCLGDRDGFIEGKGEGGTGTYTFLWLETAETSFRNSNLGQGTYTLEVQDTNGCTDTETQVITEPLPIIFSLAGTENINCFDGTDGELIVQASQGAGNYMYSLDQSDWRTVPEFTSLKALTYTPYVKDINGCTKNLTTTLTQPAKILISFETEPAFCKDPRGKATATVTGGVGNYLYEWKDLTNVVISTSNLIENKMAGNYSLTVIDNNDCPATQTASITSTDGAKVDVREITSAKCSYSADGAALLEVTEGEGPFTFQWPDGQTTIKGNNLAQGTYNVLITDIHECTVARQVDIPAPPPLAIALTESSMPSCYGTCDGRISVSGEGGFGSYVYTWSNQSGAVALNLCEGSHRVRITDSNNCFKENTFELDQPEPLQLQLVNRTLPLCNGGCDGRIEVEALGGNGNYQFTWSTGKSTSIASGICAGDHIVTLVDSKNCRLERTFQLGEPTRLQIRLTERRIPICHDGCDGSLVVEGFGGTGNYQYFWGAGLTQPTLRNLCASDYSVSVTDANSCNTSGNYTIENPPALIIDLGGSVVLCEGQTHSLDAGTSWTTYKWNSNTGITGNTQKITIIEAGQYWIDVINGDGCTAKDTFLLETSRDLLKASFLIPKEALTGDTIAIVDISWPMPENAIWTFPDAMRKLLDLGDLIHGQFDEPGIYEIGLKTTLGKCADDIGKSILILKGEEDEEGGRLGYNEVVKEFTLYPNPTNGSFEVSAEFKDENTATISIWNTNSGHMLLKKQGSGKAKYKWYIDLRPVSSGTYVLRLDYSKGKKYIRFIVN